jgi:hypothetical protein
VVARRSVAGALAVVAAGSASFGAVRWWTRPQPAEMVIVQDVPDDVRGELAATWERFEEVFPARRTCIDDVDVVLVNEVDDGDARYVRSEATIEIQIPTTPVRFRESVAHELAHHVEVTCPAFEPLQRELLRQLGLDGRPWSTGPNWYETPAEIWAEHVVELVNGERRRHRDEIPIDPAVVATIERWGAG